MGGDIWLGTFVQQFGTEEDYEVPLKIDEAFNEIYDYINNSTYSPGVKGYLSTSVNFIKAAVEKMLPTAELTVRVDGSCEDVRNAVIEMKAYKVTDAVGHGGSIEVKFKKVGVGLGGKISFSANCYNSGYNPLEHCGDTDAFRKWYIGYPGWPGAKKIIDAIIEYEEKMKKWREMMEKYRETGGQSDFPVLPKGPPPSWPDPPPMGEQRSRNIKIKWYATVSFKAQAAVGKTEHDFVIPIQDSFITVKTICC